MRSCLKKLGSAYVLVAALAFGISAPSFAETVEIPDDQVDDITEEIKNGLLLYLAGNIAEAKAAIDFASQLLSQAKAAGLTAFLPNVLSEEWARSEPQTSASGASMFGGGISATADYTMGAETCTIMITGDSPLIQSLSMMFSNPMMAGAGGSRLERVGTERVIITQDGEVQAMANTYLVQYLGNCSEENKLAYVAVTDFNGLRAYQ